jgi:hypothetical protein
LTSLGHQGFGSHVPTALADKKVPYQRRLLRLEGEQEVPELAWGKVVFGSSGIADQAQQIAAASEVKNEIALERGEAPEVVAYRSRRFGIQQASGELAASLALAEVEHEGGFRGAEASEVGPELPMLAASRPFCGHDESPKGKEMASGYRRALMAAPQRGQPASRCRTTRRLSSNDVAASANLSRTSSAGCSPAVERGAASRGFTEGKTKWPPRE